MTVRMILSKINVYLQAIRYVCMNIKLLSSDLKNANLTLSLCGGLLSCKVDTLAQ